MTRGSGLEVDAGVHVTANARQFCNGTSPVLNHVGQAEPASLRVSVVVCSKFVRAIHVHFKFEYAGLIGAPLDRGQSSPAQASYNGSRCNPPLPTKRPNDTAGDGAHDGPSRVKHGSVLVCL